MWVESLCILLIFDDGLSWLKKSKSGEVGVGGGGGGTEYNNEKDPYILLVKLFMI